MWQNVDSVYYHIKGNVKGKTLAFDLDWTLTHQEHSLMPSKPDDIQIMPGRLSKLKFLHEKGWSFIVFTNQKSKGANDTQNKLNRVGKFVDLFPYDVAVFIATADDDYRKPSTGMLTLAKNLLPEMSVKFYVGDAAGRPQDFSDSDKLFAENAELSFRVPEQVFKSSIPPQILKPDFPTFRNDGKMLIMLVGMPGCGKTTFYQTHLEPYEYAHINQDTLGTTKKVMKNLEVAMQYGKSICLDNTNGSVEKRIEYYDLAGRYDYQVMVVYIVRDGTGWNKLRESPVPDIAYHMYFKHFTRPSAYEYEVFPNQVFVINW